ncbi:MFS-type transporter clz9 [Cladobotryum mycophilum]|uniref:MFS-type transporter clz9 n=1 Tax=Cladobotryum mycophilum TaxID=491253 RepID=A0ABR0SUX3_9HYPO
MPRYTENDIKYAIQAVLDGSSLREACLKWGVPRTTLSDRIKGSATKAVAMEHLQRLSKEQEIHLREWVLGQASLGLPPTHKRLKEFATRIIEASGDQRPLGKRWLTGFLARNPEVKTIRGKQMDSVRINGATTKIIKDFFYLLELPLIKGIPPENRYNMDETGILEGQGTNGLVLGSSSVRQTIKKQPGTRCWTTIIECISATGRALSPLVVFKGQTVQQQWFPDEMSFLANWQFAATSKGWTNNETAVAWLREVFIPQTRNRSSPRVLLVVDGHGSHTTDDFMYECYRNNIYILFLPPHTSHVLQPLDISIFSPVKTAYRRAIEKYPDAFDSSPAGKMTFLFNPAKPLLSRLLLENQRGQTQVPETPKLVPLEAQENREPKTIVFITPTRSQQLRGLVDLFHLDDPAIRLLFRKIGKGLDQQNTKLAEADAKIKELEHLVHVYRPRKRQKVTEDLNSRFIRIKDVLATRKRYRELLAPNRAAELISSYSLQDLCYEFYLE